MPGGAAGAKRVADPMGPPRLPEGFTPPPPPFLGAPNVGVWRPTPPANASGATPQIATMTPWVLTRPSQFRLAPPLALTSQEYPDDLNAVRENVSLSSVGSPHPETALF